MRPLVSRETQRQLDLYVQTLVHWNGTISLASRRVLDTIEDEVSASVHLATFMPEAAQTALDVGSGNGLPAIPIALATGIEFELVESDRRKASFLREVARRTAGLFSVKCTRVEELAPATYDVITARAFAPLPQLFAAIWRFQHPATVCIFPKGRQVGAERSKALDDWSFEAESHPTDSGTTLVVRNIRPRSPP